MQISKSVFDYVVAFIALFLLLPFFFLISILIITTSQGPVFFKQKRVGKDGKLFTIYKFRSMYINTNENTVTISGDKRITHLGLFLRKSKIDELPELWNVLKGDMSLIGPRPDVPGFADELKGEDRIILEMKPGITGPASLFFFDEEEILLKQSDPKKFNKEVLFPEKVRINLKYYKNWRFKLDLKIIFHTIIRNKGFRF